MKYRIPFTERELKRFIIIFYLVGIVGMLLPFSRDYFIRLIPLNLLVTLILIIAGERIKQPVQVLRLLLVAAGGWAAEIAGVQTGILFGAYTYGAALGPKLWETPFLMTINWLVMVYGASLISRWLFRKKAIQVLFAALLTVFFDVWMEPVAIRLDMWNWAEKDIPLQNYLMWFALSLVFSLFFILPDKKPENRLVPWLWTAQLAFFIILNLGFCALNLVL